ncbi:MAG: KAP family P-loop NTPase fold protein [Methylovulum sp.]
MSDSVTDNEWNGDVLNRKKYALFLTNYLENKGEGCVININASWGLGKTFFLKKWFDDIKQNHPAVYFNAWENDYTNDPLVSIISCINKDIIPLLPESTQKSHTAKNFLSNSGKMMKKLAPIVIKGGLSKLIGEGGAEALTAITSDDEASITELSSKFAEELLSSHEATSNSIDGFKKSVSLLLKEVTENGHLTSPLFLFIDELDRCRPLYSIELLERIKHLFDIPEVVFIVATDTQQLSHSVKAIYGESFNGEIYLRRFFDQIYTLPEPNCIEFTTLLFEGFAPKTKYFDYQVNKNNGEEDSNTLICKPHDHADKILLFSLFAKYFKLDLRTKKQCFDRFIAIERSLSANEELHFGYLIFLIMLDAKYPTKFQKYFSNSNNKQSIDEIFSDIEPSLNNLIIHTQKFSAKTLIENYHRIALLTEKQMDTIIRKSTTRGFDKTLAVSFWNNSKYLAKYKERVEMAEALR